MRTVKRIGFSGATCAMKMTIMRRRRGSPIAELVFVLGEYEREIENDSEHCGLERSIWRDGQE